MLSDRFEDNQRMARARHLIPYFASADSWSPVECLPACTDADQPVIQPELPIRVAEIERISLLRSKYG